MRTTGEPWPQQGAFGAENQRWGQAVSRLTTGGMVIT
jgi:hypothetical protein